MNFEIFFIASQRTFYRSRYRDMYFDTATYGKTPSARGYHRHAGNTRPTRGLLGPLVASVPSAKSAAKTNVEATSHFLGQYPIVLLVQQSSVLCHFSSLNKKGTDFFSLSLYSQNLIIVYFFTSATLIFSNSRIPVPAGIK